MAWEGDEPTATFVPTQQQIIQAAEAAERAASSVLVKEVVAVVHPYMTSQKAAHLAAMHRVHTWQPRSKSSNREEVDSAAVAVSVDSAAEGSSG